MRTYLEVEDLWDTIEAPENGALSTDAKKIQKARGRIILAIEPEVYAYIEDAKSAKEAWGALATTFDDKGLTRKVGLLIEVATTKLENCKSMEDYVARIISTSYKLGTFGTKIPTDLVGALLLAGLPASYKPMVMALSSSGKDISADFVKTKLLEESESAASGSDSQNFGLQIQALPAHFSAPQSSNDRWRRGTGRRPPPRSRRGGGAPTNVRCYTCNRYGHFASQCTAPKQNATSACSCTAATEDREESEEEDTVCALFASVSPEHTHSVNVDTALAGSEQQTPLACGILLAVDSTRSAKCGEWIVDSGASTHMCSSRQHMSNISKSKIKNVTAANRSTVPVLGEGEVTLKYNGPKTSRKVLLKNVLHVPNITSNLISVSAIAKRGGKVIFCGKNCQIYNKYGDLVLEGELSNNNIYRVGFEQGSTQADAVDSGIALKATHPADINLWHRRMGHLNATYLKQLRQMAIGVDFENTQTHQCEICVTGKLVQKPFNLNSKRATSILELVHSDVCQVEDLSIGKAKYYITFLDDHSRKIFVYFLKQKDEVPDIVKKFIKFTEKQTGQKVKILRTDNGREYVNANLKSTLDDLGIKHQTSIAYQPQQNGRAERVNRVLLEKARCMLAESKLAYKFWAEAVSTACYLANRSPKRCLGGHTPEEIWTGSKPDLSNLRIFGSKARAYVPGHLRKKMEPTSRPAIMLGYCEDQKGYRLWSEESQKVFTASNVEFFESTSKVPPVPNTVFLPLNSLEPIDADVEKEEAANRNLHRQEEVNVEKRNSDKEEVMANRKRKSESQDEEEAVTKRKVAKKTVKPTDQQHKPNPPGPVTRSASRLAQPEEGEESEDEIESTPVCRSQRRKLRPKRLDDYVIYSIIDEPGEPRTIQEALNGPEAQQWREAMDNEYASITKNNTWKLCDLPSGEAVVGSKWIFKKKRSADGLTKYKARLVAQGFSQIKGVNYDETYSPVVRFTSLRLLFAYAARRGLNMHHLDVETAFLHGDIKESVYMQQPPGYALKGHLGQVCKLNKAIYGLKQGSRNWNLKLDATLKKMNLKQSSYDSCIYSYYTKNKCIIIALFVDDLIIFTDSVDFLVTLKNGVSEICSLKDLGPLRKCLGVNVHQDKVKGTIQLEQTDYIESILSAFGMKECRSTNTPMETKICSSGKGSPQTQFNPERIPYQSAVGSLLYLVQATRPDLVHAVSVFSRYNQSYDESHWNMVKRIFRYIQGTKTLRLTYSKEGDCHLRGYCDASWATDPEDRRSTTGYVFMLHGAAISWTSKRQSTVALSSTEAEYLSLSAATQEALWLRRLAVELLISHPEEPLTIYCDNKGAIDLSTNAHFSGRTKHIDVRHSFIKKNIDNKQIEINFIPSTHMLADTLTKATGNKKLEEFVNATGLKKEDSD